MREEIEATAAQLLQLPHREHEGIDNLKENLRVHITGIVQPSANYFMTTVLEKLADQILMYKMCRLVNPMHDRYARPALNEVQESIEYLQYFSNARVYTIMVEWQRYQEICDAMCIDDMPNAPSPTPYSIRGDNADQLSKKYEFILKRCKDFWQIHKIELPHLVELASYFMSMTTSSAAVERVFSILKRSFGPQQSNSLEDYVFLSIFYQYNDRNLQ